MSLGISWSDEAIETFDGIVLFIEEKWGDRHAKIFIGHTNRVLHLISSQPYMYKASINTNARHAVISPQTSMYYEIHDEFITLLFFRDNRQEPLF